MSEQMVLPRPKPRLRFKRSDHPEYPGGIWLCDQGAGQTPDEAYQCWKRLMERLAISFSLRFEPPLAP